jgi:hypothetical protein
VREVAGSIPAAALTILRFSFSYRQIISGLMAFGICCPFVEIIVGESLPYYHWVIATLFRIIERFVQPTVCRRSFHEVVLEYVWRGAPLWILIGVEF